MSENVSFNDLKFESDPTGFAEGVASIHFKNGYGVRVIYGGCAYSQADKERHYELAVCRGGDIHCDNPVAQGDVRHVRGELTAQDVTKLMREVANFPDQDILPENI